MTPAQRRLINEIRQQGGADDGAEYWPVVNDWVKDTGSVKALALRNINRTVAAVIRAGLVTVDDDGLFHLTEQADGAEHCPGCPAALLPPGQCLCAPDRNGLRFSW